MPRAGRLHGTMPGRAVSPSGSFKMAPLYGWVLAAVAVLLLLPMRNIVITKLWFGSVSIKLSPVEDPSGF